MRLEQAAPSVLQFATSDPYSLQPASVGSDNIICSLNRVDNNNPATLAGASPQSAASGAPNANAAASVLEAWARELECHASSPDEDDEEDEDEGAGNERAHSSSSGVSEAEEEEARSTSCPSACSSTSSEASELANLASSSSSGGSAGSDCGSTSASDDEQPASPVPPYVASEQRRTHIDVDEEVRSYTISRVSVISTPVSPPIIQEGDMSESEDEKDKGTEKILTRTVKSTISTPLKPSGEATRSCTSNNNCETLGAFDVFTMETALPKLDLAQLESHLLAAARKEDRRRRNDREEIRRRLAMGEEPERPGGRKPSLQSRLQSGMNLQLCFMNETASDCESPPDHEIVRPTAPVSMPITLSKSTSLNPEQMQREAQLALAQASAMAHMEMALERHQMRLTATPSPTSQLLQRSLHKVGVKFPPERRRVSRQLLTDLNVTQLQVLVNDLHTLIEGLNEELVQLLMERDDLHMEQDSRLVDIEDLNRYLGAKSQPVSTGLHQ